MKIKELLFVVCLAGGLIIPPLIFKLYYQLGVVIIFFICFGLMEWLAVARTGRSISQQFWEFKKRNPVGAWILVICWFIAWMALLIHFMAG